MKVHIKYEVNFHKQLTHLETQKQVITYAPDLDVTFDISESDFLTDLIDYLEGNLGYEGGLSGLTIEQTDKYTNSTSYIRFNQVENENGVQDPDGPFQAEYKLTINKRLVRGMTSTELTRLFKGVAVSDQNVPDDVAENLMWLRRGVDDTIDEFTANYPNVTEPSSYPDMAKLNLSLNGESLDLPLTSNIAEALQDFLRTVKREV